MRTEHVLIGGASDGGKTTELRRMHENFDGVSLWCNHSAGIADTHTSNVAGYRAHGRKALHTGVGRYDEWEDVRLNLKIDDPNRNVETAIGFAIDVWDTTSASGYPVATQIIVDECHHVAPELLAWILSEGRDKAIKGVFATQAIHKLRGREPLDSDLGNARYRVWVGEWSMENHGVISYYFPVEEMKSERFLIQSFNREGVKLWEGETDESYGG
jgi:hypothetical protein